MPKKHRRPARTSPRGPDSISQYGLVDPGDIAERAGQAFNLADHTGLAGLQIDRIESTVSDKPAVVLVLTARDDVECNGAAHRHAKRSHRIEHAIVRRSLGHQNSGCSIDVVESRRLGALPR